MLNKLLGRAEAEESSANAASSSAPNLGEVVPPATSALDAVAALEATEAAGALASDDIEATPKPAATSYEALALHGLLTRGKAALREGPLPDRAEDWRTLAGEPLPLVGNLQLI